MSRPIFEPNLERTDAALGYDKNQLQRRPAPRGVIAGVPTIRIYGTCTLPWSLNNTATFYTFPNLDVTEGGIANGNFHDPAIGSVTVRISVSADAAPYMQTTSVFGNPAGVGIYAAWAVEIVATGIYGVRYQGESGGGVWTNINVSSNVEVNALSQTALQNRNQHRPWAWQGGEGTTADIAAEDLFVVDEDDLTASTPNCWVAGRVDVSAAVTTDRSFEGEFCVYRFGDLADFPRFTYQYDEP